MKQLVAKDKEVPKLDEILAMLKIWVISWYEMGVFEKL